MQVQVEQQGTKELIRDLAAAPGAVRAALAKEAYAVGSRAVRLIRAEYRTTGTEPFVWGKSTWRRSAALVNSYAHDVERGATDVKLTVGAIKPTEDGQVPIQARVMEGIDASGAKVDKFVIVPRNKPWLVFPIRRGGGLATSNIIGWIKTKRVTLYPRPALDPVSPLIIKVLTETAGEVAATVPIGRGARAFQQNAL